MHLPPERLTDPDDAPLSADELARLQAALVAEARPVADAALRERLLAAAAQLTRPADRA